MEDLVSAYQSTPDTPAPSARSAEKAVMDQPMRCGRCGDVIGIYEPLVVVTDGRARTTSAAAEPQVGDERGEHFHRACHAQSPAALTAQ